MIFKNLLLGFGGLGVAGFAGYGIYYAITNNEKNAAKSQYGTSTVVNGHAVPQPAVDTSSTTSEKTTTNNA